MKFNSWKTTIRATLFVVALLAAFTALIQSAKAQALYYPNFFKQDTNAFPLSLTNGGSAVISGAEITVRPNTGLSLFARTTCTNSTATSCGLWGDVTPDGTNWTTTHPIQWNFPAAGTNFAWTNIPPTYLNNVRKFKWTLATNQTAGTTISNTVVITPTYSYNAQ